MDSKGSNVKKYFFFILAVLLYSQGWAVIHVCPTQTPTCVCSTFLQAAQTATSTPGSVIQFDADNTLTSFSINHANIAMVTSDTGTRAITVTGTIVQITNGNNRACTIDGIRFFGNDCADGVGTLTLSTVGVSQSLVIQNCYFQNVAQPSGCPVSFLNALETVKCVPALTSAGQFIFRNNVINSAPATGACNALKFQGATTVVGAIQVYGNTLLGGGGTTSSGVTLNASTSANETGDFYYNYISGFGFGVVTRGGSLYKNNIILGNNTTDISSSTGASNANFSFCVFGSAPVSLGTGCVTNATASSLFCNTTNRWLGPGSPGRNSGTSISGITGSLTATNGVLFGLDMGPLPFALPFCGQYNLKEKGSIY